MDGAKEVNGSIFPVKTLCSNVTSLFLHTPTFWRQNLFILLQECRSWQHGPLKVAWLPFLHSKTALFSRRKFWKFYNFSRLNDTVEQACPKSGPQAKCGPWSNFDRPAWLDHKMNGIRPAVRRPQWGGPQTFISPHVALLAKILDTPAAEKLLLDKKALLSNWIRLIWRKILYLKKKLKEFPTYVFICPTCIHYLHSWIENWSIVWKTIAETLEPRDKKGNQWDAIFITKPFFIVGTAALRFFPRMISRGSGQATFNGARFLILWIVPKVEWHLRHAILKQGCQTYGPRAACGPRENFSLCYACGPRTDSMRPVRGFFVFVIIVKHFSDGFFFLEKKIFGNDKYFLMAFFFLEKEHFSFEQRFFLEKKLFLPIRPAWERFASMWPVS